MSAQEGRKGLDEAIRRIEEARKSNSKSLDLSELELSNVPTSVWELSQIEELNLGANRIAAIPDALGQLSNLRELVLLNNRIAAIPNALLRHGSAGTGQTVSRNGAIQGPLGVAIAPGGDILAANALNGNLVEVTPNGRQVAVKTLDRSGSPAGAGALFGLAVTPRGNGVYFVDDATNTLDLLH